MAKLVKYLNLKFELVRELLVKTILINHGNPTAINSLARYSRNKGLEQKGKSMNSAVSELLYKAHKAKPISSIDQELNIQTESYLSELEDLINNK